MADFDKVQSIQTLTSESDLKGVLQLKIAGAPEPLTVNCSSLSAAEDLAGLIDGYCNLVNGGSNSCWNRKGWLKIALLSLFILLVWGTRSLHVLNCLSLTTAVVSCHLDYCNSLIAFYEEICIN